MPEIASRLSWEAWDARGRDELAAARERAYELVTAAEARGPLLPAGVRETLGEIVSAALAAERAATGG